MAIKGKERRYWDACNFIAIINREVGRWEVCNAILKEAEKSDSTIEIVTSIMTYFPHFPKMISDHGWVG